MTFDLSKIHMHLLRKMGQAYVKYKLHQGHPSWDILFCKVFYLTAGAPQNDQPLSSTKTEGLNSLLKRHPQ